MPYALLALSSTAIIKFTDKKNPIAVFETVFFIYVLVRLLSRYDDNITAEYRALAWIEKYLTLLFPFTLGMLTARFWNCNKTKKTVQGKGFVLTTALLVLFVMIILLRYHYQSIIYPFYVAAFIILFTLTNRPAWLNKFLVEMGKRSTSMWLIHTYFCYYFFQDFIYSFRYPILIFAALVAISYVCAVIIDNINKHALKLLSL